MDDRIEGILRQHRDLIEAQSQQIDALKELLLTQQPVPAASTSENRATRRKRKDGRFSRAGLLKTAAIGVASAVGASALVSNPSLAGAAAPGPDFEQQIVGSSGYFADVEGSRNGDGQVGVEGDGGQATAGGLSAVGVIGYSQSATGVIGVTGTPPQLGSSSPNPTPAMTPENIAAVLGFSATSVPAVRGNTQSGIGTIGDSQTNYGAVGTSFQSHGVGGFSNQRYGVLGQGTQFLGVRGASVNGYGGVLSGGLAPLRLFPGTTAGPPPTAGHLAGEQYVDSTGALYYFNGTSWKQIA